MRRVLALLAVAMIVWIVLRRGSTLTPMNGGALAKVATGVQSVPTSPALRSSATPGALANSGQFATNGTSTERISPANSEKGFRDRAHLDEHFAKHGAEFAGLNKAQYLGMAQRLRDAPAGGEILEIVRSGDGVVSRFDKRSGAFLAFDRDGTIRTFFKPNDGERYFRRQANRTPSQ
ncbi:MAG: hypothetical protein ABJB66_00830 [Gemmatimonadaceae bacterium]